MIHLRKYSDFLNESKIDVAKEVDGEIETLINDLLKNKECTQVDDGYLEIETPFELNPDSKNPEWKNKTGMVFFPELLSYGSKENAGNVQRTPWICCRITLEGERDEKQTFELLKWLVSLIKKSGYTPFMDEDATANHWMEEKKKGWTEYSCFVNPSYPEGHWENHALEG